MTINCSSESLKAYSFMRAAVYARYSTIMQRRRSLEDQTSSCKEYADSGWTISDEHIYTDSAKSGTSTAGRDAFADLKEAAAQNPPPFDAVLFDDTSRCARDVEEILSFTKLMKFYKIRVHFVSQRLDSSDMNFDMSLHMYAMFDSQLVSKIRTRVMLTQRYLVKEGFNVGSVAYGYKSVAILSADHEKMVGRGKIIGSKLVKIEEHAEVVIYIFQCFADGQTMMGIAKSLNRKMIPSPTNAKAGKSGSEWTPDAIKDILANEKYKGWNVFNRSEQEENPETKKIRKTIKPAHEHIRVYLEHIRIVSDELWQKVADRLAMMADAQTRRVLGGYNRATKQAYLYSGFLFCGHCKSKLVIGGKQGKGRYRCPSYRTRRGCSNSIALSEQILAEQITEVLAKQLLIPSNFDVLIKEVYGELQLALQNQLKSVSQDQLAELQAEHQKIALAIELLINLIEQGGSPSLVHRLGEREAQKTQLEQKIVLLKGKKNLSITPETLEAVVRENIAVLVDVLRTNVPLARLVLEQHLLKMSVFYDSKENPKHAFVTGTINLFQGEHATKNGVLLGDSSTQIPQQHTVPIDSVCRFGINLDLTPEKDCPLLEPLVELLSNDPHLSLEAKKPGAWAHLLASHLGENRDPDLKLGSGAIGRCFRVHRKLIEERIVMVKTLNPAAAAGHLYQLALRAEV